MSQLQFLTFITHVRLLGVLLKVGGWIGLDGQSQEFIQETPIN